MGSDGAPGMHGAQEARRPARRRWVRPYARQAGWAGLLVLLIAVVVLALLGKTLLAQLGIGGPGAQTGEPKKPALPGAAAEGAALPGTAPLERVRELDAQVLRDAARRGEAERP